MSKLYLNQMMIAAIKDMPEYYERGDSNPLLFPFYNQKIEYNPIGDISKLDIIACARPVIIRYDLSGIIFEDGKNLPDTFKEVIRYWDGKRIIGEYNDSMVYCQNPLHEYMVDLPEADDTVNNTEVLAEGYVIHISELNTELSDCDRNAFVMVNVGINLNVLAGEDAYPVCSDGNDITVNSNETLTVYLKVSDILDSPDPSNIYIDLIRYEMMDYGYYY